jgi:lysophospholipase L1-like esterase
MPCKYLLIILFSLLTPNPSGHAQDSITYLYINGKNLTVSGRANAIGDTGYRRVDAAFASKLPRAVADLATNTAGVNIMFQTNARSIKVKWILRQYNTLWNMAPVAVNGLDMYGWNNGRWQYVTSARPVSDTNEVVLISNLEGKPRDYKLYLPLYSELSHIEIGVETGAEITKVSPERIPSKKVVIYGSSITQGASASRPGMAYPSIMSRNLHVETFNLGFSGNGKMEIELADVLGSMEADLYILDCVPNPSPAQIKERAVPFVKRLRELKPGVPVIMVESIIREQAHWDSTRKKVVADQNREFRNAYEQLKRERYNNLYYIEATNLMGNDHEATIDGIHLTDVGFMRISDEISKTVKKVLKIK